MAAIDLGWMTLRADGVPSTSPVHRGSDTNVSNVAYSNIVPLGLKKALMGLFLVVPRGIEPLLPP